MYAVGSSHRKKTEFAGKLALGIKDGVLDNVAIGQIGYIMFHYWNNEKATLYRIINHPRIVSKQDIPDGYLLRIAKNAQSFLLLEYTPNKPTNLDNFDIKKVMRKGGGRYLPFVTSLSSILLDKYSTNKNGISNKT